MWSVEEDVSCGFFWKKAKSKQDKKECTREAEGEKEREKNDTNGRLMSRQRNTTVNSSGVHAVCGGCADQADGAL